MEARVASCDPRHGIPFDKRRAMGGKAHGVKSPFELLTLITMCFTKENKKHRSKCGGDAAENDSAATTASTNLKLQRAFAKDYILVQRTGSIAPESLRIVATELELALLFRQTKNRSCTRMCVLRPTLRSRRKLDNMRIIFPATSTDADRT